ncbi:lantibiotic dehydratase [Cellulomonas sp. 179-A 9B4 NHS]|uniref:lantibiotic dehydratase n=1 Tax=Cellulomonas sp. 179-A 9B4 NHS TaxID=3142379 RepID=UPI0039A071BE
MTDQVVYRPADAFMVRIPARPFAHRDALPPLPGADGARARVAQALADPHLDVALRAASPRLHARLRAVAAGEPVEPARVQRALRALRRYELRMSTRATPYGVFAGVTTGTFGDRTTMQVADPVIGRVRVQPDFGWLCDVARDLPAGADVAGLPTRPNEFLYRVGERLVVASSDTLAGTSSNRVDVRLTPAVEAAVAAARAGCSEREVVARLQEAFPAADTDTLTDFVATLLEHQVITRSARPALDTVSAAARLAADLRAADPDRARALEDVDAACAAVTSVDGLAAAADRLHELQTALLPDGARTLLAVDAGASLVSDGLSRQVGDAVADAAATLVRIAGSGGRAPHLRAFEQALVEREGLFAEVPLLELVSAELGLEAPDGYAYPPRSWALPAAEAPGRDDARDAVLTALLLEHAHGGDDELELTDAHVEALAAAVGERGVPRPALDVFVAVAAASARAVDEGDFRVVLPAGSMAPGGRSFGRFTGLLGPGEAAVSRLAADHDRVLSGTRTVDLRYLSYDGRSGNVSRSAVHHDLETVVNCSPTLPPEQQVRLEDVLVGSTGSRLYLRWARTGELLRFTQNHMLSFAGAPNAVRLLLEVSQDGVDDVPGFDWGRLWRAPRLPRVVRGRTVLSPARWTVEDPVVSGWRALAGAAQADAVRAWCAARGVPRHVYAAEVDNRLAVDLERDDDVQLLVETLDRAHGAGAVEEMLPAPHDLWLTDAAGRRYAPELVVPVVADTPAVDLVAPAVATAGPVQTRLARPLDAPWVNVSLYASEDQLDVVVADDLEALVAAVGQVAPLDAWFFIRYADPAHHLRLRLRPREHGDAPALRQLVTDWAADAVRRGRLADLRTSTFRPELGRYGGAAGYEAALPVFRACSHSAAAVARYRRSGDAGIAAHHLGAALLAEVHDAWTAADPSTDLLAAVPVPDPASPLRTEFREHRRRVAALVSPDGPDADLDVLGLRAALDPTSDRLRVAVEGYAAVVRDLGERRLLPCTARTVLESVQHMRLNRALPMRVNEESRSYGLWRLGVEAARRRAEAIARVAATSEGS